MVTFCRFLSDPMAGQTSVGSDNDGEGEGIDRYATIARGSGQIRGSRRISLGDTARPGAQAGHLAMRGVE